MAIPMIATDLDGTLLRSDESFTPRRCHSGCQIGISRGRTDSSSKNAKPSADL